MNQKVKKGVRESFKSAGDACFDTSSSIVEGSGHSKSRALAYWAHDPSPFMTEKLPRRLSAGVVSLAVLSPESEFRGRAGR